MVLEDLYRGNIRFDTVYYPQDARFVEATQRRNTFFEKLAASLGEAEKGLFDQYCEASSDVQEVILYNTYVDALKFGIHLMIEVGLFSVIDGDGTEEA